MKIKQSKLILSLFCLVLSLFCCDFFVALYAEEAPATPPPVEQPATPPDVKEPTPAAPESPAPAPEQPVPPAEPPSTPEQPATPVEPAPEPVPTEPAPDTPAPAPEQPAEPEPTTTEQPSSPATPTEESSDQVPAQEGNLSEAQAVKTEESSNDIPLPTETKMMPIWHTNSIFCSKSYEEVLNSSNLGDPEACFELGLRIYSSTRKKKEIKNAISYIEKAAAAGYPEAQLWVAEHYESGKYYPKNYRQSYLWCKKAADQNQPRAQYFLSLLYIAGRGVIADSTQSAHWCQISADNAYPPAMTRIANLYQQGLGVPQNAKLAIHWFLKGAMYNDSTSQYNLGLCYEKGNGVRVNSVEAYKWFNIAASQGNAQALSARQKIEKRLNSRELKEGQERSIQFARFILQHKNINDLDPLSANLPIENTISGFFVTDDGYILTSYYPLINASALYARTSHGYFEAQIVQTDTHNNIALLKIDNHIKSILNTKSDISNDNSLPILGPEIKPLALSPTTTFEMRDPVFTIAFPSFDPMVWSPKLSEGNVKGLSGIKNDPRYLKIGILINSQNTGAPIITATGEVIGILDVQEGIVTNSESELGAYRNALRSQYALTLFESLPEVKSKLKAPSGNKEQKFNDSVAQAIDAVVQIIIY